MDVQNGVQARLLYSIALPTVFISQTALINALIETFGLTKPKWFKVLWFVGVGFLLVSIVFRESIYPVFQKVPDGYFFATLNSDVKFTILKIIVYCWNLFGFISVLILGLRRQRARINRWFYALIILIYTICLINDSIILQHHRTLYPTAWIGAVLLFAMIWYEIHCHMREIYSLVHFDGLTGAHSRTYGEAYLSQCLKNQNVGVFYADIDNFKSINDTYGHHAGDEALKQFIQLTKPVMHAPNLSVRLGGDEFLFLFPNVNHNDEGRLRMELESMLSGVHVSVDKENQIEIPLVVSLGWSYALRGESWLEVLHSADLSMYRAKESHNRPLGIT